MTAQMDPEVARILREPFPPEQIGKLPRITCRDCSQARNRVCDRHSKSQCTVCGNWITGAHMHLDYIGHAAITDRLLKADPGWSMEPAYRDVDQGVLAAAVASGNAEVVAMVIANAPPLMDGPTGMWVKLTVGGVTRLGYGTDDDPGMDHDKKLISDALRNAAMRFGVGLDLWSKEALLPEESPVASVSPIVALAPLLAPGRDWAAEARACTQLDVLLALGKACSDAGQYEGAAKVALLKRRNELRPPASATGNGSANGHSSNGRRS